MKADERSFLQAVHDAECAYTPAEFRPLGIRLPARRWARDVATDLAARNVLHPKRAHYLLRKWVARGWYNYGVSLDLGWLTAAGQLAAESLTGERADA